MSRTLLSKSHLWRSTISINHITNFLFLHKAPKTKQTLFTSPHSAPSFNVFFPPQHHFCTTPQSNEPPSTESNLMQTMEKKIKEQLNAETVAVKDAYGDGRHVSVHVISEAFEGHNTVNRQRMVYKAIWEELEDTVHAVHQMVTLTPAEAKSKSPSSKSL